jgi:H+/Cl- antiporter ClcA
MLATGAACGVSGNFGSPLGGVLFSIEVTSTYYPVRNYMFAYVACVIASISFLVARQRPAFLQTAFALDDWLLPEIPFYILIGIAGGLFGTLYTKMNQGWFLGRKLLATKLPIVLKYVHASDACHCVITSDSDCDCFPIHCVCVCVCVCAAHMSTLPRSPL